MGVSLTLTLTLLLPDLREGVADDGDRHCHEEYAAPGHIGLGLGSLHLVRVRVGARVRVRVGARVRVRVRVRTPHRMATAVVNLPATVAGVTSP